MVKSKSRKVIRGEKHHWWPKSLSKHWVNEKGLVHRIDSTGKVVRSKPKEFAHISDGHNILFNKGSSWESTIENYFDTPDNAMPQMVRMIEDLRVEPDGTDFISYETDFDELNLLRECILSLLVRSPRYRSSISSFVTSFRGDLDKPENKMLIAANMNQKYSTLLKSAKNHGRVVILFSDGEEFIFGDGLYSNLSSGTELLGGFRTVVPLTPNMAVIWSQPMSYRPSPKLSATLVDSHVVHQINTATQVFSKDYLFYKSVKPTLIDDFTCNEHRKYQSHREPVARLVDSFIPDTSIMYGFERSVDLSSFLNH